MKKILLVTYYWPPSGGSGVQRWLFFSHYLAEKGFELTVLTIDPQDASFPSLDPSFLAKTQGIKTIHVRSGFSPIKYYSLLKKGDTSHVPVGDFGSSKKSRFDKLAGFLRANIFIPDARMTWNKSAIKTALKLTEETHFDLMITTGPPHSTHLIGLDLKKRLGLKWIADFRDPWTEVYYNDLFKRTKFALGKDASLEKQVLSNADLVLTVGPSMRELLLKKNYTTAIEYIYNGFDHTLFDELTCNRYPEFTIAHIGVWKSLHAHQEIIDALKYICVEKKHLIRFLLAGSIDPFIVESLKQIDGLTVDFRGTIQHKEAVQEMLNADLLLNCQPILPGTTYMISGKSMEYLASGNYCITIGNLDSDLAKLMDKFSNSKMIEPYQTELLTELILTRIQKERMDPIMSNEIRQYSRESATDKLIDIISEF